MDHATTLGLEAESTDSGYWRSLLSSIDADGLLIVVVARPVSQLVAGRDSSNAFDEAAGVRVESGRAANLTQREREVARLMARGLSNRAIATELVVAEKTVKNHVQRILEKLNLSSRTQLAAQADTLGLMRVFQDALPLLAARSAAAMA